MKRRDHCSKSLPQWIAETSRLWESLNWIVSKLFHHHFFLSAFVSPFPTNYWLLRFFSRGLQTHSKNRPASSFHSAAPFRRVFTTARAWEPHKPPFIGRHLEGCFGPLILQCFLVPLTDEWCENNNYLYEWPSQFPIVSCFCDWRCNIDGRHNLPPMNRFSQFPTLSFPDRQESIAGWESQLIPSSSLNFVSDSYSPPT